jgi:hypothetical protein
MEKCLKTRRKKIKRTMHLLLSRFLQVLELALSILSAATKKERK